jgi:hypothetical protein
MSYTPNNMLIYLAAFSGALSGMGAHTRGQTSHNPAAYGNVTIAAANFAQEIDTLYMPSTVNELNVRAVMEIAEGLYAGRYQEGPSALSYQDMALTLIAMVQEAELYAAANLPAIPAAGGGGGTVYRGRGVISDYVDITSFSVLPSPVNDDITYQQGDLIVLAAQDLHSEGEPSNPEQNGPWIVGPVVANLAPLVRPAWWSNGSIQETGAITINIGAEGTLYANTTWKAMGPQTDSQVTSPANTLTVGTDDPGFYAETMTFTLQFVSGTVTAYVPILSYNSGIAITPVESIQASTQKYCVIFNPGSIQYSGMMNVTAETAIGSTNTDEDGFIQVTISNQCRNNPGPPP